MSYGRALGGAPLAGDQIVRIVYLDDAGISNPQHEPFVVVAGVMIDGDGQWRSIEAHLSELADEYAPPERREEFFFHATELYSGGGFFPRKKYNRECRWRILDEIMKIPGKFDLPILLGFAERATFMGGAASGHSIAELTTAAVTSSFVMCAMCAERVMREVAPDEVAIIVMENNDQARQLIRNTHNQLRKPEPIEGMTEEDRKFLPLTKIIESPLFQEKTESSILQVADACAFVIKRHLMATAESARFYRPLIPNLMARPISDCADVLLGRVASEPKR